MVNYESGNIIDSYFLHLKLISVYLIGMTTSIRDGSVVTLPSVGLFADGAAVKTIGSETYRICSTLVDDMITVSTDQICNAIKLTYNDA